MIRAGLGPGSAEGSDSAQLTAAVPLPPQPAAHPQDLPAVSGGRRALKVCALMGHLLPVWHKGGAPLLRGNKPQASTPPPHLLPSVAVPPEKPSADRRVGTRGASVSLGRSFCCPRSCGDAGRRRLAGASPRRPLGTSAEGLCLPGGPGSAGSHMAQPRSSRGRVCLSGKFPTSSFCGRFPERCL